MPALEPEDLIRIDDAAARILGHLVSLLDEVLGDNRHVVMRFRQDCRVVEIGHNTRFREDEGAFSIGLPCGLPEGMKLYDVVRCVRARLIGLVRASGADTEMDFRPNEAGSNVYDLKVIPN